MNNSVFGQTMETVRNHVDVKLLRTADVDKIKSNIAKPAFAKCEFEMFNEDLVGI